MDVVGIGGASFNRLKRVALLREGFPFKAWNKPPTLVWLGSPDIGLPSVITLRTHHRSNLAISRANTPPRLQPIRLTLRPSF